MSAESVPLPSGEGKSYFLTRLPGLLELGFSNYREYLDSLLWKNLRDNTLRRANGHCRLCGAKANQVHHRSYSLSVLRGDTPAALVALCDECHRVIEFDGDRKCALEEVEVRFRSLRGRAGRIILHKRIAELASLLALARTECENLSAEVDRVKKLFPNWEDELLRDAQRRAMERARVGVAS